ncbi:MAG: CHAT domain-containing protein, partial [Prochlorothrix sp.]
GNGSSFLGTVNVTNTTIANNTATSGSAGGIQSAANTVLTLTNSLLADNRTGSGEGGDVVLATGVSPTLNGINLIENATGLAPGPTLLQGVDPKLSPLGSYGGPTQTHLILPGSVAIDAGDSGLAVGLLDQRGGTRVVGTAIDLGAVEFQGANFSIVAGDGQSTTVNTNFATPLTVISATETTFGNSLSGGTVTFSAPTSGASATLASPSTVLDTSSQGSTLATANTIAGTFAVTASLGTSSTTFTLTNLAGAPSNLIILGGNNQSTIVNTAFSSPLSVQVTDQYGNPVSGTLVAFTAPTSGASSQNTNLSLSTNSNGTASTAYSANTVAGSYPVTSTVANTSISTAFSLTNLAGAPSNLIILGGNNQSTIVNTAFSSPLSVQVTDQYGNPVSGTLVAFTAPTSGASSQNTNLSLSTNSNGTASTAYSANTVAGSYPVTSTVANTSISTAFSLTNLADAPSVLTIDTGNNQSATIDTPFTNALTVLVTDQYGNPVSGVPVNFAVQGGLTGASGILSRSSGVSDANGRVSTTLTANVQQGSFQVVAQASGFNASATFDLQNTSVGETACPPNCDDSITKNNDEPTSGSEPPDDAPLLVTPNAVTTETVDNTTFTAREAVQTDAFSTYLNIPSPGPLTVGEAQNIIRDRDEATGTTTAYITSRFAPITTSGSEISSRLQNSGPAADQMAAATPVLTKELDPLKPWLGQLPGGTAASPDDRLEIVVMTAAGTPQLKRLPVTRRQVELLADRLQQDLDKPVGVYRRHMQALYAQLFAPLEAELEALGVDQLLLSLGESLRSIPWGALYDGEQFLVEKYGIGVTPSLSLTDTTYAPLHDRSMLAMGASEFESQNPLPAVPIELNTITQQLETASSFLNQDFTVTKLLEAREQLNPGVIHLATHANFQAGDLDQSYIQLWGDERISIGEIDRLQWFADPPVELLVLSACRTALGDRQAELGFGGLAVKSGVRSAMASLWYVSDAGTLALMTEFYRNLRNPEITTKAEALRQAQIALIRGDVRIESAELRGGSGRSPYAVPLPADSTDLNAETLAHPYYWAAFTLIGNPW